MNAKLNDDLVRTCPLCGKQFTVLYPSVRKKWCSGSCAVQAVAKKRLYTGELNPNYRGGKASHPLYDIYNQMLGRCLRTSHARYKDYGARGITVCDRWQDDFWNFVDDMGEKPSFHSLERIDNDGPYSPQNCKWATSSEQARNSRPKTRGPDRDSSTGRFKKDEA